MSDGDSKNEFLDIDLENLEKEWSQQPRLCNKWNRRLADARLELDRADSELDVVRAELDLMVRAKPKRYRIPEGKITEAAVKAAILNATEYQKALAAKQQAKHKVDLLVAACKAIDHRKTALENEVDLWIADYFSTPRARSELSREVVDKIRDKKVLRHPRSKRRDDDEE